MFASTSVVSRGANQVSCNFDNEVAILEMQAACYYGANEVGIHIWRQLEAPQTVAAICRSVEAAFEVDPDTCRADVVRFLGELHAAHLIEISEPKENESHD